MAKKPAQETETSPVASFEQSLGELEKLVEQMEHGDMTLEQSLSAYENGVRLYRQCQGALEAAELRVRVLSDPDKPDTATEFAPQSDD